MSLENINRFKQMLEESGYSRTNARLLIFKCLQSSKEPLTLREIYMQLQTQIDRTSVYRNVELFELLGVVRRIQIGWKYKLELSEAYSTHHHHAVCSRCGAITSFEENKILKEGIVSLASDLQFSLAGHSLELQGICKQCAKK